MEGGWGVAQINCARVLQAKHRHAAGFADKLGEGGNTFFSKKVSSLPYINQLIQLSLARVELVVSALHLKELIVSTALDYLALLKHHNSV